jgi:hypothetical protein
MLRETLFRVGGWAAIIAGVLRAAGSFTSSLGSDVERQSLYFSIFLLIAVFTVYAQNHAVVGPWGAAGFLTTVAGILLVRSSRAVPGLDLYPAGALGIAGGWAVLALASWYKGRGSVFVPVLFTLSIVTAIAGQLAAAAPAAFVASGVIFSAAVVSVGLQVLKA